jgi:hypothetical protein
VKIKKRITSLVLLSTLVSSIALHAANNIGNPSGTLTFNATVIPACGVTINGNEGLGGINFDTDNTQANAKFTVYSNSKTNDTEVEFINTTPTDNIKDKDGRFKIYDTQSEIASIGWKDNTSTKVNTATLYNVSAHIPHPSNEIEAGEAIVTTTLTISCS